MVLGEICVCTLGYCLKLGAWKWTGCQRELRGTGTAIKGICVVILFCVFRGRIGVWVLHATGLAKRRGSQDMKSVDEESTSSGSKH